MPIELIAKVLEISVAAVKWSLERVDGVAAQVRLSWKFMDTQFVEETVGFGFSVVWGHDPG